MTESDWTCPGCGSTDPHHQTFVCDNEIEVDVTCQNVYLLFNDDAGDPGMVLSHEQFEEVIEHYRNRPEF